MAADRVSDHLAWALQSTRQHTLTLVEDVPQEQMCLQSIPGEHHPTWILGHLLLSDTYLLSLLKVRALTDDFAVLLQAFGPGASPTSSPEAYESKQALIDRLSDTGTQRLDAVRAMTEQDLLAATPDPVLARTQPTLRQHLLSLVFHEGYHSGQLSAWRKAHGLGPARWVFASSQSHGG
jgi:hypothetical protein